MSKARQLNAPGSNLGIGLQTLLQLELLSLGRLTEVFDQWMIDDAGAAL